MFTKTKLVGRLLQQTRERRDAHAGRPPLFWRVLRLFFENFQEREAYFERLFVFLYFRLVIYVQIAYGDGYRGILTLLLVLV